MSNAIAIMDDIKEEAIKVFDLLDVSENTRNDYKYRIGVFLNFIKEKGLNKDSFLEFKRYLTDRNNLSVSTKNKHLATARVFLKELNRQGAIPVDITQNIKSFKQNKKHKKDGLNDEEIKKLTSTIKELPHTISNTRLKAIIALLIYQGLRQIEVIRLDVSDIDLNNRTVFVRGKGRDDKEIIYLHPETIKHLREYLKTSKIKDGALFTSLSNNHKNKRFTTRALRQLVKDALNGLGIEKTTHGLRHYFTTKLIKAYKGNLLEVANYTRHKSLEMLQVYYDGIKREGDLPRFYKTFSEIRF